MVGFYKRKVCEELKLQPFKKEMANIDLDAAEHNYSIVEAVIFKTNLCCV
jgi:hypothetical protein